MMKVGDWMSRQVQSCRVGDTLNDVAHLFWSKDRGWIPVLDTSDRLVGVVTDRDTCLGAHFAGRPLFDIRVSEAMARDVRTCKATEELAGAATRMGDHRVRRMAVIDDDGYLIGVLALADVARAAVHGKDEKERHDLSGVLAHILAAVTASSTEALQPSAVIPAAPRKEPALQKETKAPLPATPAAKPDPLAKTPAGKKPGDGGLRPNGPGRRPRA